MDEKTNRCVSEAEPDYKMEYHRHIEQIAQLTKENQELKNTIIGMCKKLFGKEHKDVNL